MTRKYYFSRPLSEVIERRKGHYLAQVEKTLDTLYKRANVPTIEKYERNLCELSSELDYDTYVRARNSGMDNDSINAWFKTDSQRQVAGFNMTYSRLKKKRR